MTISQALFDGLVLVAQAINRAAETYWYKREGLDDRLFMQCKNELWLRYAMARAGDTGLATSQVVDGADAFVLALEKRGIILKFDSRCPTCGARSNR